MTGAEHVAAKEDIEQSLRRLESLIAALESIPDRRAQETARALLEVVLDLHGLALARIAAIATVAGGPALLERLAVDDAVRAMLLLHGLHPEELPTRIAKALAAFPFAIELVHADGSRARVRVHNGRDPDIAALRVAIETAIVEAAPELDEILIEGLEEGGTDATGELAIQPQTIVGQAERSIWSS